MTPIEEYPYEEGVGDIIGTGYTFNLEDSLNTTLMFAFSRCTVPVAYYNKNNKITSHLIAVCCSIKSSVSPSILGTSICDNRDTYIDKIGMELAFRDAWKRFYPMIVHSDDVVNISSIFHYIYNFIADDNCICNSGDKYYIISSSRLS